MAKIVVNKREQEKLRQFFCWHTTTNSSGCWEWKGPFSHDGYGKFYFAKKHWRVHRLSYMIYYGAIGSDVQVLHKCDNTKCCNPIHLFLGDTADNMLDAVIKGGFAHRFKYGHTPKNAKVLQEEIVQIKSMLGLNIPPKQISKQTGVSRYTVNDIKRGRSYNEA